MSFGVVVRRSAMSAAAAIVALLLGLTAGAAAAGAAPVWGPGVTYGTPGPSVTTLFTSVSCVGPGNCVAVGLSASAGSNVTGAVVAAESAGTWGPATPLAQLPDASCMSATSCVAVGDYTAAAGGTEPMEVPIAVAGSSAVGGAAVTVALPSGAKPAGAGQDAPLTGVSCDGTGACTAVGFYTDTSGTSEPMIATPSGATWTATEVTRVPSAARSLIQLTAISCPPTGGCQAVGHYADAAGNQQPWTVTVTGGVAGQGVTVGLPSDAQPVHDQGFAPTNFTEGRISISCPSSGVCTAADNYVSESTSSLPAIAIPIVNGSPGPVTVVSSVVGGVAQPTGIACADATDCSIGADSSPVGGGSVVAVTGSESGGTWGDLTPLQLNDAGEDSLVTGFACASVDDCVATGFTRL
jgi:hypothetical protein